VAKRLKQASNEVLEIYKGNEMKSGLTLATIFLVTLLAGCAGVKVAENGDSTKTVTSNEGTSLNGGWNTAAASASSKAQEICKSSGKVAVFLNESREGAVGWTRLSSTITFKCVDDIEKLLQAASERYEGKIRANSELEPISKNVELIRVPESSVPFGIASNNNYPTADEAKVIAKWASIRDEFLTEERAINAANPPNGNVIQQANQGKLRSFNLELGAKVSELIVALYQGKLTYGEFAQKRYEIAHQLNTAARNFYTAILEKDREMQIRQQNTAEQQVANNLAAWGAYMQGVNSRPVQIAPTLQPIQMNNPSPARLQTNCTSQKLGSVVTTACN
jgi:hypothetical protein